MGSSKDCAPLTHHFGGDFDHGKIMRPKCRHRFAVDPTFCAKLGKSFGNEGLSRFQASGKVSVLETGGLIPLSLHNPK